MKKDILIGIDIGGTTVKHAIIDTEANLVDKWEIPTRLENDGEEIPVDIYQSIEEKLAANNIDKKRCVGIGIGAPGFIDPETGIVTIAVNIGWRNFDLKSKLENLSNLPVIVENDANIAALGENWKGAGNQVANMLAVTLGTGVGGGIISNGQIVGGANGTGGEIGHITVEPNGAPCNCGRSGCLETVASATGIVRLAMEQINQGKALKLKKIFDNNGAITTKDIFKQAENGDVDAKRILAYVINVLGLALANIAITTNPSKVVIGGGVSKAGDQLLQPLKESFNKFVLARTQEACEFEIAELGNDAGVFGAAFIVLQEYKNTSLN
ncbi:ROK family glucokinase [Saliterribacillus persicus]|uniref:Glucokinase n=1 Tax=Saliterribacillus persicus TaxID=930114 RepID=A0A368XH84_9BACI|nr:ROK family glucokinase [Saliterribacillus persicus]RCW65374.1 glucokinase [Saliterribacillus persicus]